MKAVVVYESLWGNTAAIARAVAEGIGTDARALSTAEATPDVVADADLVVAGAPLLGFKLPDDGMRESIRANKTYKTPDLSHPSMRDWLAELPAGTGRCAGFETRIWWSPGSAAKTIAESLTALGYSPAAPAEKFIVGGKYGPLKKGELDRARAWGATLARATVA
jgi:hypothetical protein